VIGAGEPALPGIALGHNEHMGYGFTIVGIDQGDLYVERVNPEDPGEYFYKGAWRKFEVVRETLPVKGVAGGEQIELRYTIHGPVIAQERGLHRAYALKWVGAEPGGAGYLGALSLSRARNWTEFRRAAGSYKVPSENLVYADTAGNIGWIASGRSPIRPNWTGLLPVPGDTGEYEWKGYLEISQHPQLYNPAQGYVATANHNILPPNYPHQLGYEWALPFRAQRVKEMIEAKQRFSSADFQAMQQDVLSIPARRFQAVLKRWKSAGLSAREAAVVEKVRAWDCRLLVNSQPALIFEVWMSKLQAEIFGAQLGARVTPKNVLESLEARPDTPALAAALRSALGDLDRQFGRDMSAWQWGKLHTISFRHPAGKAEWNRGPVARPGDANTVNSTSGSNFRQTNGASFRMILDLSDWDKAVMTNVPGESADPASPHYSDLLDDWAQGRYHPMPYTRKAVEAAAAERIHLAPKN
jgi:penicillin amidase